MLKKPGQRPGRAGDQRGLGLVETLVAVALLGTSVVAFAAGLSAGSIAVGEQDNAGVAQGLAQSQMEDTKSAAFSPGAGSYPTLAAPAGYSVSVGGSEGPGTDADLQKITVTVFRDGQSVLAVTGYKGNR